MTAPSDAMSESGANNPAAVPAPSTAPRPLYWSVRRELWEHRSLHIAPLAVAAVVLFGYLLNAVFGARGMHGFSRLDPAQQGAELAKTFHFTMMTIVLTTMVVAVFYCLGALNNERRDRSILFWKSLPVSDLVTVASKAAIPLLVLPAITFAVVVAMQTVMLLISTLVRLMIGISPVVLWTQLPLFQMWGVLLYGLVAMALWYAPIYGWLLMVSAWARRAAFLWAVLPPLLLCLVEKIAFDTSHFAALLGYRLAGGFGSAFRAPQSGEVEIDPVAFLTTPGLWVGLAVAAAFLAGAVWLRRRREPI